MGTWNVLVYVREEIYEFTSISPSSITNKTNLRYITLLYNIAEHDLNGYLRHFTRYYEYGALWAVGGATRIGLCKFRIISNLHSQS